MIGRTVGHYQIKERLGGGGMGVVYKAEDVRLGRTVALKFLPPELTRDQPARARFIEEARAASALDHPNICAVYDIGETPEGESYICMAYYDGVSLKRRLADGPLPLAEAIGYAEQICVGLAKAHEKGIIHRDIKPDNVMVTSDGVVKIVDFGVAKLIAGGVSLTQTGMMVGTAAYVAPEQARGVKTDHRSDLWSLGVLLYQMVGGRLPFEAEHVQGQVLAIIQDSEPPIASLRSDVPIELARLIHRCLRKNPAERYRSAGELRAELRRIRGSLSGQPVSSANGLAPTLIVRRPLLRRRLPIAALVAAGAAALVGAAWLLLPLLAGPAARLPAQRHVVVLPFANIGGDPGAQAFCDGLAETLTSTLTRLAPGQRSLWVVPASQVRGARVESAEAARRRFGASLAVTGSVQRGNDAVRVTLNLVDAASLRQIASAVIDDTRDRLASLQDGAALEVAAMLGIPIGEPTRHELAARRTAAPHAYERFLEGRGALLRYEKPENIAAAIEAFQQALARDPGFAAAHAGLAEAYFRNWNIRHDPEWVTRAEDSCTRALGLDPRLAAARITLGMLRNGTGRYEEAAAELRRALERDPANSEAHRELARALAALGRPQEAEATYLRAIALNPDYWAGYNALGGFYAAQGRWAEAAAQFERVVALAPDNFWGHNNLGAAYSYAGERDRARAAFERSIAVEPNHGAYSNLGTLAFQEGRYNDAVAMYTKALEIDDSEYGVWGNLAAAAKWADQRSRAQSAYRRAAALAGQRLQVNPRDAAVLADLAVYRAELGEGETARDWIGKALARGYPREEAMRAPDLAALREDPTFAAVLRGTAARQDTREKGGDHDQ